MQVDEGQGFFHFWGALKDVGLHVVAFFVPLTLLFGFLGLVNFHDGALLLNLDHLLLIVGLELLLLLILELHGLLNMLDLHLPRIPAPELMIHPMHQLLQQSFLNIADLCQKVGVFVLDIDLSLFVPAISTMLTSHTFLGVSSSWQNSNDS